MGVERTLRKIMQSSQPVQFNAWSGVQDVWPVATRMTNVYIGGGNGVWGTWDSGLQNKGPSAPYLRFSVGGSKVGHRRSAQGIVAALHKPCTIPTAASTEHMVCCQQAKTPFMKEPGIETTWSEPLSMQATAGVTLMKVCLALAICCPMRTTLITAELQRWQMVLPAAVPWQACNRRCWSAKSNPNGFIPGQVELKNHYKVLPDRPLGEATIDLRALPDSGQVVDLQLLDVSDRERPVMASLTFTVQSQ